MTIGTVTVSGSQYTVYCTVEEADAHLAVDPVRSTAWAAKSADQKAVLLAAATNRLDLMQWAGEKAGGASQKNAWPRTGVAYPDGTPVPPDAVPYDVERACALLAGTIASSAAASGAGSSGSNIRTAGAGSAKVEFFRPTEGVPLQDATAFALVRDFLGGSAPAEGSYGLASGTGACGLADRPYGDLTRGFA